MDAKHIPCEEWEKIVHDNGEVSIVSFQADGCSTICKMNICFNPEEHADHILTAVKSHQKLVDTVKTILGQIEEGIPFHATSNNEKLLKDVLAKAGA